MIPCRHACESVEFLIFAVACLLCSVPIGLEGVLWLLGHPNSRLGLPGFVIALTNLTELGGSAEFRGRPMIDRNKIRCPRFAQSLPTLQQDFRIPSARYQITPGLRRSPRLSKDG